MIKILDSFCTMYVYIIRIIYRHIEARAESASGHFGPNLRAHES